MQRRNPLDVALIVLCLINVGIVVILIAVGGFTGTSMGGILGALGVAIASGGFVAKRRRHLR